MLAPDFVYFVYQDTGSVFQLRLRNSEIKAGISDKILSKMVAFFFRFGYTCKNEVTVKYFEDNGKKLT